MNCADGYKSEVIATNPLLKHQDSRLHGSRPRPGQSAEEIIDDFPSLTRDQVEAAIEYAKAYPKRGCPISRAV
ncbi:DUF433 domain-containing protein [Bradyrhizobium ottawaense]|uniref:DUF433 domain-containing protein n=1 Tax=Bradyrhizobium ottawaense TaxID=931866 RepID=UPI003F9EFE1C